MQFIRFSNIEEVDGDLSLNLLEHLRGLVDAPKVKGSIRISSCPNIPDIEKSFYRDRKNQFPKEDYYKEFLNWIILNKRYDDLSINHVVWPDEYLKIIQDPNFKSSIDSFKKFNI